MSCRIQKSRQVLAIVHEKKLQLQHRGLRRPAVWLAGWLAGEGALDAMSLPHGTVG